CHKGTRLNTLEELKLWAVDSRSKHSCCWITGIPGSGKSTLIATIAEHFKDTRLLCAQYFISSAFKDTTDPKKLFPSLALQLSERSPGVAWYIHNALKGITSDHVTKEQAERLLLKPIQVLSQEFTMAVIVIDAIDE
ncbi:hypothetical protein M422DRAFT_125641, partial [Sphaerobolus stellatus SS14]